MPLAAFPKCFLDRILIEKTMTPEDWVEMAGSLDVDGLELLSTFIPYEQQQRLEALRQQAAVKGFQLPMMCHSPDFTHPDPEVRQREVERQKDAIRASGLLGGSFCRVLSGQRHPGVSVLDGVGYAAEAIHACLPTARELGIVLTLENHYKDGAWDYPEFAQKMDVFLEFVEAVGDEDAFGINYDPSNAIVAGDDPIELLQAVKYRVVTMHASDRWLAGGATLEDLRELDRHPSQGYAPFLKHGVIGEGLNDYDRIFQILAEVDFNGWVSIEDGQDPECGMDHLHRSAAFLRQMMAKYGLP